jgi:hypothetical protein
LYFVYLFSYEFKYGFGFHHVRVPCRGKKKEYGLGGMHLV